MNFAVAKSYLIHQGTLFSTTPDTDLSDVRYVDGRAVLDRDTLRAIQKNKTISYPGEQITKITKNWVDRQTSRARQSVQLTQFTSQSLKKVASERVYVYDG
jgi:hypothetical protein